MRSRTIAFGFVLIAMLTLVLAAEIPTPAPEAAPSPETPVSSDDPLAVLDSPGDWTKDNILQALATDPGRTIDALSDNPADAEKVREALPQVLSNGYCGGNACQDVARQFFAGRGDSQNAQAIQQAPDEAERFIFNEYKANIKLNRRDVDAFDPEGKRIRINKIWRSLDQLTADKGVAQLEVTAEGVVEKQAGEGVTRDIAFTGDGAAEIFRNVDEDGLVQHSVARECTGAEICADDVTFGSFDEEADLEAEVAPGKTVVKGKNVRGTSHTAKRKVRFESQDGKVEISRQGVKADNAYVRYDATGDADVYTTDGAFTLLDSDEGLQVTLEQYQGIEGDVRETDVTLARGPGAVTARSRGFDVTLQVDGGIGDVDGAVVAVSGQNAENLEVRGHASVFYEHTDVFGVPLGRDPAKPSVQGDSETFTARVQDTGRGHRIDIEGKGKVDLVSQEITTQHEKARVRVVPSNNPGVDVVDVKCSGCEGVVARIDAKIHRDGYTEEVRVFNQETGRLEYKEVKSIVAGDSQKIGVEFRVGEDGKVHSAVDPRSIPPNGVQARQIVACHDGDSCVGIVGGNIVAETTREDAVGKAAISSERSFGTPLVLLSEQDKDQAQQIIIALKEGSPLPSTIPLHVAEAVRLQTGVDVAALGSNPAYAQNVRQAFVTANNPEIDRVHSSLREDLFSYSLEGEPIIISREGQCISPNCDLALDLVDSSGELSRKVKRLRALNAQAEIGFTKGTIAQQRAQGKDTTSLEGGLAELEFLTEIPRRESAELEAKRKFQRRYTVEEEVLLAEAVKLGGEREQAEQAYALARQNVARYQKAIQDMRAKAELRARFNLGGRATKQEIEIEIQRLFDDDNFRRDLFTDIGDVDLQSATTAQRRLRLAQRILDDRKADYVGVLEQQWQLRDREAYGAVQAEAEDYLGDSELAIALYNERLDDVQNLDETTEREIKAKLALAQVHAGKLKEAKKTLEGVEGDIPGLEFAKRTVRRDEFKATEAAALWAKILDEEADLKLEQSAIGGLVAAGRWGDAVEAYIVDDVQGYDDFALAALGKLGVVPLLEGAGILDNEQQRSWDARARINAEQKVLLSEYIRCIDDVSCNPRQTGWYRQQESWQCTVDKKSCLIGQVKDALTEVEKKGQAAAGSQLQLALKQVAFAKKRADQTEEEFLKERAQALALDSTANEARERYLVRTALETGEIVGGVVFGIGNIGKTGARRIAEDVTESPALLARGAKGAVEGGKSTLLRRQAKQTGKLLDDLRLARSRATTAAERTRLDTRITRLEKASDDITSKLDTLRAKREASIAEADVRAGQEYLSRLDKAPKAQFCEGIRCTKLADNVRQAIQSRNPAKLRRQADTAREGGRSELADQLDARARYFEDATSKVDDAVETVVEAEKGSFTSKAGALLRGIISLPAESGDALVGAVRSRFSAAGRTERQIESGVDTSLALSRQADALEDVGNVDSAKVLRQAAARELDKVDTIRAAARQDGVIENEAVTRKLLAAESNRVATLENVKQEVVIRARTGEESTTILREVGFENPDELNLALARAERQQEIYSERVVQLAEASTHVQEAEAVRRTVQAPIAQHEFELSPSQRRTAFACPISGRAIEANGPLDDPCSSNAKVVLRTNPTLTQAVAVDEAAEGIVSLDLDIPNLEVPGRLADRVEDVPFDLGVGRLEEVTDTRLDLPVQQPPRVAPLEETGFQPAHGFEETQAIPITRPPQPVDPLAETQFIPSQPPKDVDPIPPVTQPPVDPLVRTELASPVIRPEAPEIDPPQAVRFEAPEPLPSATQREIVEGQKLEEIVRNPTTTPEELFEAATTDKHGATALPAFESRIAGEEFELIEVGLSRDSLKGINQQQGHDVGSAVIRAQHEQLLEAAREAGVPVTTLQKTTIIAVPVDKAGKADELVAKVKEVEAALRQQSGADVTLQVGRSKSAQHENLLEARLQARRHTIAQEQGITAPRYNEEIRNWYLRAIDNDQKARANDVFAGFDRRLTEEYKTLDEAYAAYRANPTPENADKVKDISRRLTEADPQDASFPKVEVAKAYQADPVTGVADGDLVFSLDGVGVGKLNQEDIVAITLTVGDKDATIAARAGRKVDDAISQTNDQLRRSFNDVVDDIDEFVLSQQVDNLQGVAARAGRPVLLDGEDVRAFLKWEFENRLRFRGGDETFFTVRSVVADNVPGIQRRLSRDIAACENCFDVRVGVTQVRGGEKYIDVLNQADRATRASKELGDIPVRVTNGKFVATELPEAAYETTRKVLPDGSSKEVLLRNGRELTEDARQAVLNGFQEKAGSLPKFPPAGNHHDVVAAATQLPQTTVTSLPRNVQDALAQVGIHSKTNVWDLDLGREAKSFAPVLHTTPGLEDTAALFGQVKAFERRRTVPYSEVAWRDDVTIVERLPNGDVVIDEVVYGKLTFVGDAPRSSAAVKFDDFEDTTFRSAVFSGMMDELGLHQPKVDRVAIPGTSVVFEVHENLPSFTSLGKPGGKTDPRDVLASAVQSQKKRIQDDFSLSDADMALLEDHVSGFTTREGLHRSTGQLATDLELSIPLSPRNKEDVVRELGQLHLAQNHDPGLITAAVVQGTAGDVEAVLIRGRNGWQLSVPDVELASVKTPLHKLPASRGGLAEGGVVVEGAGFGYRAQGSDLMHGLSKQGETLPFDKLHGATGVLQDPAKLKKWRSNVEVNLQSQLLDSAGDPLVPGLTRQEIDLRVGTELGYYGANLRTAGYSPDQITEIGRRLEARGVAPVTEEVARARGQFLQEHGSGVIWREEGQLSGGLVTQDRFKQRKLEVRKGDEPTPEPRPVPAVTQRDTTAYFDTGSISESGSYALTVSTAPNDIKIGIVQPVPGSSAVRTDVGEFVPVTRDTVPQTIAVEMLRDLDDLGFAGSKKPTVVVARNTNTNVETILVESVTGNVPVPGTAAGGVVVSAQEEALASALNRVFANKDIFGDQAAARIGRDSFLTKADGSTVFVAKTSDPIGDVDGTLAALETLQKRYAGSPDAQDSFVQVLQRAGATREEANDIARKFRSGIEGEITKVKIAQSTPPPKTVPAVTQPVSVPNELPAVYQQRGIDINSLAAKHGTDVKRDAVQLGEKVGEGTVGVVYAGRIPGVEGDVVFKAAKPTPNRGSFAENVDGIFKEFENAKEACVIVKCPKHHGIYEIDGVPYLAVERVEGKHLNDLVAEEYVRYLTPEFQQQFKDDLTKLASDGIDPHDAQVIFREDGSYQFIDTADFGTRTNSIDDTVAAQFENQVTDRLDFATSVLERKKAFGVTAESESTVRAMPQSKLNDILAELGYDKNQIAIFNQWPDPLDKLVSWNIDPQAAIRVGQDLEAKAGQQVGRAVRKSDVDGVTQYHYQLGYDDAGKRVEESFIVSEKHGFVTPDGSSGATFDVLVELEGSRVGKSIGRTSPNPPSVSELSDAVRQRIVNEFIDDADVVRFQVHPSVLDELGLVEPDLASPVFRESLSSNPGLAEDYFSAVAARARSSGDLTTAAKYDALATQTAQSQGFFRKLFGIAPETPDSRKVLDDAVSSHSADVLDEAKRVEVRFLEQAQVEIEIKHSLSRSSSDLASSTKQPCVGGAIAGLATGPCSIIFGENVGTFEKRINDIESTGGSVTFDGDGGLIITLPDDLHPQVRRAFEEGPIKDIEELFPNRDVTVVQFDKEFIGESGKVDDLLRDLNVQKIGETVDSTVPDAVGKRAVPLSVDISSPTNQQALQDIKEFKPVEGTFQELLWTHNVPVESIDALFGSNQIDSLTQFGRSAIDSGKVTRQEIYDAVLAGERWPFDQRYIKRGANFRYGLDSEFGEIKFVMKKDFETKYRGFDKDTGTAYEGGFFNDFFEKRERIGAGDLSEQEYKRQLARDYEFRQHLNDFDASEGFVAGDTAFQRSYLNPQLETVDAVPLNDVEAILVPEHLYDHVIASAQQHGFDINRIRKVEGTGPEEGYYAFHQGKRIGSKGKAAEKGVARPAHVEFADGTVISGSSSNLAVDAQPFSLEEKAYLELLVEQVGSSKIPSQPTPDVSPIPKLADVYFNPVDISLRGKDGRIDVFVFDDGRVQIKSPGELPPRQNAHVIRATVTETGELQPQRVYSLHGRDVSLSSVDDAALGSHIATYNTQVRTSLSPRTVPKEGRRVYFNSIANVADELGNPQLAAKYREFADQTDVGFFGRFFGKTEAPNEIIPESALEARLLDGISESSSDLARTRDLQVEEPISIPGSPRHLDVDAKMDDLSKEFEDLVPLFDADAGVWEGYTIREHNRLVSGQLNEQRQHYDLSSLNAPPNTDLDEVLETVIPLHDIGKPLAISAGEIKRQHEFTLPILREKLQRLGFSENEIKVAEALVGHDILGDLARGLTTQERAVNDLTTFANRAGMSVEDFYELQVLYYVSDATSYPTVRGRFFTRLPDGRLVPSNSEFQKVDGVLRSKRITAESRSCSVCFNVGGAIAGLSIACPCPGSKVAGVVDDGLAKVDGPSGARADDASTSRISADDDFDDVEIPTDRERTLEEILSQTPRSQDVDDALADVQRMLADDVAKEQKLTELRSSLTELERHGIRVDINPVSGRRTYVTSDESATVTAAIQRHDDALRNVGTKTDFDVRADIPTPPPETVRRFQELQEKGVKIDINPVTGERTYIVPEDTPAVRRAIERHDRALQDAGTKTEYEVVAELGDVDIVDVARSDVRQPSAPFKYDDQKALEDVLDELAKKDVKSVVNILNDRKQVDVARSVTLDLDVEVLLQRQRELLEAQGVHQVEFPGAQYQPGVDRPALTADNVVDELGLVGESVAEQRAGLQRLRESAPTAQKEVYQRALDELDTFVEWEAKSGFGKAWDAVKRVFTRKAQPERPVTPKVDRVPVSRTDNADSLTGVSSRELDLHIKDKSDAGTSFQSCSLPGFGGSGPVCATTYGDGGRADRYFPPAYERGELEVRDILTNDDGIILLTNEGPILLRENGDIMAYGGRFEENRISLAPDGHIASISESPRIRKQFDDIAKEVREGRRASREVTVDDARVIAARQKVLDERLTANVGDNVLDAVFMNPHGTHDNFIQAYDEISQSNPVLQALHARFFENGIPVQLRNPELPVEYSSSNVFAIYGHGGVKYAVFADESELARLAGKRYNFDTIEEAKRLIAREQAERVAGHETFHVAFDKLLTEAQEDDWLAFVFDSQDPNIRRMLNWLRDSPTYSSGNAISHADEVLAYRLHYHTFGVAELKQVDFPAVPGEIDMFKRLGLLPDDFVPPAIVDDVVDVAAPRRAVPDTLPIEAAPSCSICVNVGGAIRRSGVDCPCITLSSSIKDNPSLLRLTEDAVNDQAIERELNNLIKQLSRGNFEAGLGRPGHISGTSVFYLRGRNGGRLYYRKTGENQYQIVAKSAKGRNQDQVINKIKDDYKT